MTESLTANTQAILLLTAPFLTSRKTESPALLSLEEYNRLARLLREHRRQPGDLVEERVGETLEMCASSFERERLQALLNRGFQLSQAFHRWSSRAIRVLSRADAAYPRRLKTLLKEDCPPVLYHCGDLTLVERAALAVVGSRHVTEELIEYAERVGRLAAPRRVVVSGGAKGIDQAAMNGALLAGGRVVGVLGDSLERAVLAGENRDPLLEGRLALISPYDPLAGFDVGNAMERNKLIYALADAALVVASEVETGGMWAGAIEQLERYRSVPVFVRANPPDAGNAELIQRGGLRWPEPATPEELDAAVSAAVAGKG